MRLKPETLRRVATLKNVTGKENRTALVSKAITLAEWAVTRMEDGAKIYAEYPNGNREHVVIPGLEPSYEENEPEEENRKPA